MSSASTTRIAPVTGMSSENAAAPTNGSSCLRISSVAYATDDRLSEANTASAVALFRRSCSSSTVCNGAPRKSRFRPYSVLCLGCSTAVTAPPPDAEHRLQGDQRAEEQRVGYPVRVHIALPPARPLTLGSGPQRARKVSGRGCKETAKNRRYATMCG